jgi:hypothetical protein
MRHLLLLAISLAVSAVSTSAYAQEVRGQAPAVTPNLQRVSALITNMASKNYTPLPNTQLAQRTCPAGYYAYWCPYNTQGFCCPNGQLCRC